ncbi:LysE family transporter [Flavobacterium amniphilum]|uniref:LysE family transporter n=1 Tax=Flavobacterium amniphilum TaxID=1834035 RepID=UPI002029F574|nr:LysE family transporter [Flavobacterium amniphilum]MCL9806072.1 LysE family transporter [Flavobacterium amniphilum]
MAYILPLLFGFAVSVIGILPPGLINMTAARISLQDGRNRAMMFTAGAVLIIFFQTYLALIFARYIDAHQNVVILLREIGFGIFALVTVYFLFIAKKPKGKIKEDLKIKSKKSRFFLGMLISAINFFPIPYYVFVSVTLASFGYFNFEPASVYSFVLGVVLGSFLVFYTYIAFFNKIQHKTEFIMKNMNIIIGSITGVISVFTLYNILKYYFKF